MARRPRTAEAAHLADLIRSQIPPMHRAGWPFVGAGLAVAALGYKHRWARTTGLVAAAANAAFFRNPTRVPPARPGAVVAPADGEICLIELAPPPVELGLSDEPRLRVSIFLSILDAHVQRAPIGGQVVAAVHQPGRFLSADLPEASEANERNSIVIHTPDGAEVIAVQIAGLVARRIVCDVAAGDHVGLGDTYGLIRFGSRLDTYLPAGTQLQVALGQRAVGGETILAEIRP
ncbi:MAG: phosphatidylserine decarboxylase [Mycobacterium sp.]|nr:phosphatidylserine decarboxylase [Mycobacterium sp.]